MIIVQSPSGAVALAEESILQRRQERLDRVLPVGLTHLGATPSSLVLPSGDD